MKSGRKPDRCCCPVHLYCTYIHTYHGVRRSVHLLLALLELEGQLFFQGPASALDVQVAEGGEDVPQVGPHRVQRVRLADHGEQRLVRHEAEPRKHSPLPVQVPCKQQNNTRTSKVGGRFI